MHLLHYMLVIFNYHFSLLSLLIIAFYLIMWSPVCHYASYPLKISHYCCIWKTKNYYKNVDNSQC